jgi:hypothetical protein
MVRRIILGLVLVALIALCYLGYINWKMKRSMLSGDVTSGPGEPLPSGTSLPLPSASPTQRAGPVSRPNTAPEGLPQAATYPATDSQGPESPEGARFAGSGRYQVYRQGNLTYRIDTSSGKTCVLYATEEEWRKPQVYQHGCGGSAAQ